MIFLQNFHMESPLQFCSVHILGYQLEIGPLFKEEKNAWGFPWQTHFEGEDAQTDTPENDGNGSNPIQSTFLLDSHAEMLLRNTHEVFVISYHFK